MANKINVEATINAPVEKVWEAYTNPDAITAWNAPSDDWHCPKAENDLQVGGRFLYRMEARDGSEGFDFTGVYTSVTPHERIAYTMDDPEGTQASDGAGGREVETVFTSEGESTHVAVSFDPENENPEEFQRQGWQAILDNFKKYVENK